MASTFPLQSLAKEVENNAIVLQNYYEQNGLFPKSISEQPNCLPTLPPDAPEHVQAARKSIYEHALKMQQLVTAPNEFLEKVQVHYQQLECLKWLCHFDIFSHLPSFGDSTPYSTVAATAGVPEAQLKSVARMAVTNGLLTEPEPDALAHSRISAAFVAQPSLLDWAIFMTETSSRVAACFTDATDKWGGALAKSRTAWQLAHDTDKPFFDHLAESPDMARRFAGFMQNATAHAGTAVEHLLRGFDWKALGKAHVVDVGGSSGHASIALAQAFPDLTFTVQDLPDTLAASAPAPSALPIAVRDRISFAPHDFFKPQPPQDPPADVYLLRMILHDWSATDAAVILRAVAAALRPGGRILLMDTLLPEPGSVPASREALLRVRDLTMLQTFASCERDARQWAALVAAADPGLAITNVVQPEGSTMAVLEVCWELPN